MRWPDEWGPTSALACLLTIAPEAAPRVMPIVVAIRAKHHMGESETAELINAASPISGSKQR
jgi:hypothetical protein